jgi:hypothetical protein
MAAPPVFAIGDVRCWRMRTFHRGKPRSRMTPSRHGAAAAAAPDQGREARLDLSEGSAVVMMLALRDSPWRQPRNPARHISPKALVLRAECLLERRFFDHHHPDLKKKPE